MGHFYLWFLSGVLRTVVMVPSRGRGMVIGIVLASGGGSLLFFTFSVQSPRLLKILQLAYRPD